MRCAFAGYALALSLAACASNVSGVDRALRIREAQYFEGALPGVRDAENPATKGPRITSLSTANFDLVQGQGNKSLQGRASKDADAVGIALDGASGYWVVPVGAPDPATDEFSWSAVADFGAELAPGKHALRVVAIGANGVAGAQLSIDLCLSGRVPDNRSRCYPDREPPHAVISLQWDVNADLDLQVVGPEGEVFLGKRDAAADSGEPAPADPSLDRDSTAGCVFDGLRTENLVWTGTEPTGRYRVYVNLYDACKQPAVRFSVGLYVSAATGAEAANRLHEQAIRYGELLDVAANPAAQRGLFVAEFEFN